MEFLGFAICLYGMHIRKPANYLTKRTSQKEGRFFPIQKCYYFIFLYFILLTRLSLFIFQRNAYKSQINSIVGRMFTLHTAYLFLLPLTSHYSPPSLSGVKLSEESRSNPWAPLGVSSPPPPTYIKKKQRNACNLSLFLQN